MGSGELELENGVVRTSGITVPDHGDPLHYDVFRTRSNETGPAILVAHGFKGFKDWGFFPWLCGSLAQAEFRVLVFNFSLGGVGESRNDFIDLDAFGRNTFSREQEDLAWMMAGIRNGTLLPGDSPSSVGLLGHSKGGGGSVLATGPSDDAMAPDCLVTWASIATFDRWPLSVLEEWEREGVIHILNARTNQEMPLYITLAHDLRDNREALDIRAAAGRVEVPWLVVHGDADETVMVSEGHDLAERGPAADLFVVAGAGHTFEATHPMGDPPETLLSATRATLEHFGRYLP